MNTDDPMMGFDLATLGTNTTIRSYPCSSVFIRVHLCSNVFRFQNKKPPAKPAADYPRSAPGLDRGRSHSEEPGDLPVVGDVDRARARHLGQAGHRHDVAADHHDELGA